jgi:hypothetical protein
MNAIRSVVKNGRVEVDAPPEWPDGTPVRVELGLNGKSEDDDEGPETPEEIQAWLHWYHSLEPIVMTREEEAAWEADRQMQKEFDIANAAERDQRIEGIFE